MTIFDLVKQEAAMNAAVGVMRAVMKLMAAPPGQDGAQVGG